MEAATRATEPISKPKGSRMKKNYEEIRNQIQSGDILLCSGDSTTERLIKRFTYSKWSHCGILFNIAIHNRNFIPWWYETMVLESVESVGVKMTPLEQYVKNYNCGGGGYPGTVSVARHNNLGELHKMFYWAGNHLGYNYDRAEIARIIAKIMASKTSARYGKAKRNEAYICSEFVYECFKQIGIGFEYDKRGFIAPKDIAKNKNVKLLFELKTNKPAKKRKRPESEPHV